MSALKAILAALAVSAASTPAFAAPPTVLHVTLGAASNAPVSGRLIVFAEPVEAAKAEAKDKPITQVEANPFNLNDAALAAQEVTNLAPGATVDVDADITAFPKAFSKLKPGRYVVQAVLDRDHSYNYSGRGAGDLVSPVVEMDLPAGGALTLTEAVPARDPWTPRPGAPPERAAEAAAARPDVHALDVESPLLSEFWGRPIHMRGWVVTPPGYAADPKARYPTVYYTHGYGGTLGGLVGVAVGVRTAMVKGQMPPMLWVLLDESSPTGTHEFADSVNNGPWGQALTTELIPQVERDYRTDGKPSSRFLNGHSSGGWAVLWLQTRYPKVFGGAWPTSPDPSDFHDFTGPDIYAPGANLYAKTGGGDWPIWRDKGEVVATMRQFAGLERVLGPYGGQMASFDWVFSPKGEGGAPQPMFDRDTGAVDPAVVAYWRDHYDIAYRLQRDWPMLKPDLDGKIHLTVGTADTFYLDGAAHRLEAVMKGLGAKTDFRYLDGRTHFDLYVKGDDRQGLLKDIAWEMYALARPGSKRAGS